MLINGKNFTFGADPEIFVKDKSSGKFVSAHDLVPGTKLKPHAVPKGAVQVDGMALEFNIDPAENYEEFEANLFSVKETLASMIGDKQFIEDTSVFFDKDFIKDVPAFNLALGCEADYNGWTLKENPKACDTGLMRTAGGHIHIGGFPTDEPFSPPHFEACGRLARILDHTLGVYSLLWDKDDKRRDMYGKAGSFRPKVYGMEYRTLSNKWIFNPSLVKFVFEATKKAVEHMFDPSFEPKEVVREIIDTSNRDDEFFINNPTVKYLGV